MFSQRRHFRWVHPLKGSFGESRIGKSSQAVLPGLTVCVSPKYADDFELPRTYNSREYKACKYKMRISKLEQSAANN